MIEEIKLTVKMTFVTKFWSILLVSLFLFLLVPETCYPKIHFNKEYVVIFVEPREVSVIGHYYMLNSSHEQKRTSIAYPFCGKFPKNIEVTIFEDGQYSKVNYRRSTNQNAIVFSVFLKYNIEQEIKIRYTQELSESTAIYVLKSTKEWMEKLLQATFEIVVPKTLKNLKVSYQTNESIEAGKYMIYRIMRSDFMPQQDLVISWEENTND